MTMKIKSTLCKLFMAVTLVGVCFFLGNSKELPTTKIGEIEYYYYDIQPGDDPGRVMDVLGVSRQEIYDNNRQAEHNWKEVKRLYFPTSLRKLEVGDNVVVTSTVNQPFTIKAEPTVSAAADGPTYVIKEDDTLNQIAISHGLTLQQLLEVNPQLNYNDYLNDRTPFIGMTISIADPGILNTVEAQPEIAQQDTITEDPNNEYNIAVMLPFMLDKQNVANAERYIDFYRGFLLAADENNYSGTPVNIYAYDTKSDLATVKELMNQPEMAEMSLIIAPENSDQLDYIISAVDPSKTYVVNSFIIKDQNYVTKPNVVQAALPYDALYDEAIEAFINHLDGRIPVFVTHNGFIGNKSEFTERFKSTLDLKAMPSIDVSFKNSLQKADLDALEANGQYVMVPASSDLDELNKILPQIKAFNRENSGNIILFGYPEWVAFTGGARSGLFDVGAICYSRYTDAVEQTQDIVAKKFKQSYNRDMIAGFPSQAMLGYDTGNFFIPALRDGWGNLHKENDEYYHGVQTDFCLSDNGVSGLQNNALILVKFDKKTRNTSSERLK